MKSSPRSATARRRKANPSALGQSVDNLLQVCYNKTEEKERKVTTMKTTKIAIIATIITTIIITLCGVATANAETDRGEFYPRLAVVTAYEQIGKTAEWIITVTDKDGHEWDFYGEEEDAHIGNIFNLLMWNMGEAEEDNEIVEVYYEGCMDVHTLTDWLTGAWQ